MITTEDRDFIRKLADGNLVGDESVFPPQLPKGTARDLIVELVEREYDRLAPTDQFDRFEARQRVLDTIKGVHPEIPSHRVGNYILRCVDDVTLFLAGHRRSVLAATT